MRRSRLVPVAAALWFLAPTGNSCNNTWIPGTHSTLPTVSEPEDIVQVAAADDLDAKVAECASRTACILEFTESRSDMAASTAADTPFGVQFHHTSGLADLVIRCQPEVVLTQDPAIPPEEQAMIDIDGVPRVWIHDCTLNGNRTGYTDATQHRTNGGTARVMGIRTNSPTLTKTSITISNVTIEDTPDHAINLSDAVGGEVVNTTIRRVGCTPGPSSTLPAPALNCGPFGTIPWREGIGVNFTNGSSNMLAHGVSCDTVTKMCIQSRASVKEVKGDQIERSVATRIGGTAFTALNVSDVVFAYLLAVDVGLPEGTLNQGKGISCSADSSDIHAIDVEVHGSWSSAINWNCVGPSNVVERLVVTDPCQGFAEIPAVNLFGRRSTDTLAGPSDGLTLIDVDVTAPDCEQAVQIANQTNLAIVGGSYSGPIGVFVRSDVDTPDVSIGGGVSIIGTSGAALQVDDPETTGSISADVMLSGSPNCLGDSNIEDAAGNCSSL